MQRKIDVIDDFNGRKIVFIHDIIFKKKQYVEWKDVRVSKEICGRSVQGFACRRGDLYRSRFP